MKNKTFDYILKAFNSLAYGFFSTLIVGIILVEIGKLFNIEVLMHYGKLVQYLMGPAIGISIASVKQLKGLELVSAMIAGAIGAGTFYYSGSDILFKVGDPVGSFVTALIVIEVVGLVANKTSFDIFVIPITAIITAALISMFISPPISSFTTSIGQFINSATTLQPALMGMVVAVVVGMCLTAPISSAAIVIALNLSGLAAGAAAVGCATQMIGFAVMARRDNKLGDVLAIGIGTSMLLFSNIIRKPTIWLPTIIASAILGPVSSVIFNLTTTSYGAGVGLAGFSGPLIMISNMPQTSVLIILLMLVVLPAILVYLIDLMFYKANFIKKGDLALQKL